MVCRKGMYDLRSSGVTHEPTDRDARRVVEGTLTAKDGGVTLERTGSPESQSSEVTPPPEPSSCGSGEVDCWEVLLLTIMEKKERIQQRAEWEFRKMSSLCDLMDQAQTSYSGRI